MAAILVPAAVAAAPRGGDEPPARNAGQQETGADVFKWADPRFRWRQRQRDDSDEIPQE